MEDSKKDILEQEYKETVNNHDAIRDEIDHLEKYKIIKKYHELQNKLGQLNEKEKKLYKERLLRRYASCRHILVESDTEVNFDYEGRTYHYHGCIKCGFDSAVANRGYSLNREEHVMLEIMNEQHVFEVSGIDTGIHCDINEAKKVYNNLKEKNPDLDDESMAELFKMVMNKEHKPKTLKYEPKLNEPRSIWDWPL